MKYALIDDSNTIVNIIAAEPEFAEQIRAEWTAVVDITDQLGIDRGDIWDGTSFSKPLPDLDALGAGIRSQRDQRLAACDWTQLADVPLSTEQRAEWVLYRQALRDITAQEGFPTAVTWPQEPGGEPERARNELGQFVADDPATPDVNEAWVEGAQP